MFLFIRAYLLQLINSLFLSIITKNFNMRFNWFARNKTTYKEMRLLQE